MKYGMNQLNMDECVTDDSVSKLGVGERCGEKSV